MVRNAEKKDKVPVMAVVGVKEMEAGEVAVRRKGIGDVGSFGLEEFVEKFKGAIEEAREFTEVGRVDAKEEEEGGDN